ncbi:hypothetical protein GF378_01115 [Candidatus Pacearchaeota archaeon]|nr:hypothetical protein [Candidatus Pacearchaeota archaeon]
MKTQKILRDKKAGHVGMILSFVIFITFLVFLYSITEPVTRVERGKQDLLQYLQTELIEEFTEDMTTSTISINESLVDSNIDCIKFEVVNGAKELNAVVKTANKILDHERTNNNESIIINREGENFFKIYYSGEFSNTETENACSGSTHEILAEEREYNRGLVRTEEHIFETKILEMIENFESNYSEIKNTLNIAPGSEFGFAFVNSEDNEISTPEKNVSMNVYVEQIPIQYIDSEANIKPGYLNIRVW